MKTIRKNSNEYKIAKENANLYKRYDLENYFNGQIMSGKIDDSYFKTGKLIKLMNAYRLCVHSNLWFEWSVA